MNKRNLFAELTEGFDALAQARQDELAVLTSSAFATLLQRYAVRLQPLVGAGGE